MNFHALRIFAKVAALKSVTKASEDLNISQPAVTIQIRNLESVTGLKLVETSGRGIKLTSQGEFLFQQSQRLFNLELDIENKIEKLNKGELEAFKISSTYLPSNYLLPRWLAKFKKSNPLVAIQLSSGNSHKAIQELLHYKADLAFVVQEDCNQPEIEIQHLMDIEYWFIVPSGHKLAGKEATFSEVVKEPLLFREEGSSTREILLSMCKLHRIHLPNIGIQFPGLNESIQSVIAGYGTMLAPSLAVNELVAQKRVGRVFVKEVNIKRPVYLCIRKGDSESSSNQRKFIKFVKTITNQNAIE